MERKLNIKKSLVVASIATAGSIAGQLLEKATAPRACVGYDWDGDVDGIDFAKFASCYNKTNNLARCVDKVQAWKSDLDHDGDVDSSDFAKFALCYGGAGRDIRDCDLCIRVTGRITSETDADAK